MNGEVVTEAPRPRPLSGGLWTLFSWLRREERASIESISSVGSDRTVASFAYLGPGHYAVNRAPPLLLPPQGPPSDTYKKRVRDRNLRWQHDRDITIHRKYGLYGYDAFSLPNSRRSVASATPLDRCERDRRAISETLQRRAHVPGKRRAPPPPSAPTSLQRRQARKRQAPQPPVNVTQPDVIANINIGMKSTRDKKESQPQYGEPGPSNKFEKKSKKDVNSKEPKIRHEKSFLKQIFENKKRNSAIDTSTVKLLPNISELDKQAAEIIERYKLKELARTSDERNFSNDALPGASSAQTTESWICTRCLRKYNGTVVTCTICLPLQNNMLETANRNSNKLSSFTQTTNISSSPTEIVEDQEKLKEMLKEMKDSLHKKQNAKSTKPEVEPKSGYPTEMETPTLRIGSHVKLEINEKLPAQSSSAKGFSNTNINNSNEPKLATIENVLVTQPVVLEHTEENIVVLDESNIRKPKLELSSEDEKPKVIPSNESTNQVFTTNIVVGETKSTKHNTERENVNSKNNNTPLKISSLLNPIYVPKTTSTPAIKSEKDNAISTRIPPTDETNSSIVVPSTSQNNIQERDMKSNVKYVANITVDKIENPVKEKDVKQKQVNSTQTKPIEKNIASTSNSSAANIVSKLDEHSRRRELVNQLERSIAKGDEQAAAEAAIKLAQLRLTCSVLSFSSQIMCEPSTSDVKESQTKICNELTKTENQSQVPSEPSTTIIGLALIENNINKEPVLLKDADKKQKTHSHNSNIINEIIAEKMNSRIVKNDSEMKPAEQISPPKASSVLKPKITEKPVVNSHPITTASTSSSSSNLKNDGNEEIPILIWVEDKEKTRGPVQLHIRRLATVGELRKLADKSLGLDVRMQRWIVGQTLCCDDKTPLLTLAGPELNAPFYLCLVEPDSKELAKREKIKNENIGDVYNEMVKLEKQALVTNAEVFECEVCMEEYGSGKGVVLRDCVHSFCKECLADVVKHSEEPIVTCPATGCPGILQEREIRALVTLEDYEKWLARGLAVAESGTRNAFHCRTRDCTGWALCEPGVRRFPCPVCKHSNCVPCQAIHEGQTCKQYQEKMKEAAVRADSGQTDDDGTRALLNSLITRGEALECPECKAIITKKWGCDWVKCSACKTEICWVTRGRRWGPAGRGDTSAGCRCGVDGNKCHPSCSYCH